MGFFRWLHKLFVPSQHNAYRPPVLRRRALVASLAIALVAEGILVANLMARQSGHSFLAAVVQSEIILLTNTQRAQNSVGTLKESVLLDQSAQAKADDMATNGYFAHQSPDGKQPWAWITASGYDYQYAGENLAVRFVDSKDVINGWMASPTHRANIIKQNYTEIGVGIAQGVYKGQVATFVVQHFGKPTAKALALRAQGQVLGAEVGPAPSFVDSISRQAGRLLSEPRETTAWILGAIMAVLLLALGFAFFHHIQIQAHDLLVPGAVVATVALLLLLINSSLLSATITAEDQPASVALYGGGTVVITPEAASDEQQESGIY